MDRSFPVINLIILLTLSVAPVHGCANSSQTTVEGETQRSDGAIRITNCKNNESCQNPAFSPDGKELIFTKFINGYNGGPSAIIRMNLDNQNERVLIPAGEFDHVNVPGSSWKNGTIAYSSDDSPSGREEIHTVDQFGSNKKKVTLHSDDSFFIEPTFSKDGSKIVFEKSVCPINNCDVNDLFRGSIWVVGSDGADLKRLLGDTKIDYRLPNWAPTGNKILFQKRTSPLNNSDEPIWDIWTMDEDGTNLKNITASSDFDTDASWSWDGNVIVYSSDFGGLLRPNIYTINSSGGTPVRMTHSTTKEDGAPSFSPDGQHIAFESHKTSDEDSPTNIWLISVSP